MNNGTILDIYFIAHSYAVNVSSYHGVKPDATFVAHYNIADNGSIRSNKTIGTKHGAHAFNRKNNWHRIVFYLVVNFFTSYGYPQTIFSACCTNIGCTTCYTCKEGCGLHNLG